MKINYMIAAVGKVDPDIQAAVRKVVIIAVCSMAWSSSPLVKWIKEKTK